MKTRLFSICLFAMVQLSYAQTWTLVWSDEFSGDAVDPANWTQETGGNGWGNNELQYYTNQGYNATVSDGTLQIIAREENFGDNDYTSARLITRNLHSWTYGKVQARIKLPSQQGLWPAFWMLGENISEVGWPQCGEIDVMEHVNEEPLTHGTMHWNYNGHQYFGSGIANTPTDYHVYSIEWDEENIKWFLDGVLFHTGIIQNNFNNTEEFHNPFFLLLNVAVGGNWPGPPDNDTTFPATMFIDYVRVYQKIETSLDEVDQTPTVTVYPNPSSGSFMLELDGMNSDFVNIEVTDMMGRLIEAELIDFGMEQYNLDLSSFPNGQYSLKVIRGQDVMIKPIIKLSFP